MLNIQKLLPEESRVDFNPSKLREKNFYICTLSEKTGNLVYFDHTNDSVYRDTHLECLVIAYLENDDDTMYVALEPCEKQDRILYIQMDKIYKGDLSFFVLLS